METNRKALLWIWTERVFVCISLLSCKASCLCRDSFPTVALEVGGHSQKSISNHKAPLLYPLVSSPAVSPLSVIWVVSFPGTGDISDCSVAISTTCGHLFRHQALEIHRAPLPVYWTNLKIPHPTIIIHSIFKQDLHWVTRVLADQMRKKLTLTVLMTLGSFR